MRDSLDVLRDIEAANPGKIYHTIDWVDCGPSRAGRIKLSVTLHGLNPCQMRDIVDAQQGVQPTQPESDASYRERIVGEMTRQNVTPWVINWVATQSGATLDAIGSSAYLDTPRAQPVESESDEDYRTRIYAKCAAPWALVALVDLVNAKGKHLDAIGRCYNVTRK